MPNAMTIRTKHYAFRHFTLCLTDALRKRKIKFLIVAHMVKFQSGMMNAITTIKAAHLEFMSPKHRVDVRVH